MNIQSKGLLCVFFWLMGSLAISCQMAHAQTANEVLQEYTQRHSNPPDSGHAVKPGPFKNLQFAKGINFDSLHRIVHKPHSSPQDCGLGDNFVYGFHPHWMGSAWKSYNFKLLSHVSYFAYQVDCATGGYKSIGDFLTTGLIEQAHSAGCRVDLTITTVGSGCRSRDFLKNATAVDTCIATLSRLMKEKNLDGVCVDMEDIYGQDSTIFNSFLKKLRSGLRRVNPDATVSVAGFASAASSRMNLPDLNKILDFMVVMGYDYSYSGSKTAGPVAPMPGGSWTYLNLQKTVDDYLDHGFSKDKLVLALPYYGYEWTTTSSGIVPNNVSGKGTAQTFRKLKEDISPYYQRFWDNGGNTSYYTRSQDGQYQQAWVPDSTAMALKFDLVLKNGLKGTGMWALGYDNGYHYMWNLLEAKFASCETSTPGLGKNVNLPTAMGLGARPQHPDAYTPDWMKKHRWWLVWGLAGAILLLAVVVSRSSKAREEVFNRYTVHYLILLLGAGVLAVVHDLALPYLGRISSGFPWFFVFIVVGTALGFWIGKIWERKRNS